MYIEIDPQTRKAVSRAGQKALDECPFLPFALAEAARFCKKYPGRFELDELQSVATEALIAAPTKDFRAKKEIRGALADFARDGHKVVRDIEMSEEHFARTRGGPRSNARLMAGPGKASSKHGKVRLALGNVKFNDGWSQKIDSRWVRAVGIEDGDDNDREPSDPRDGNIVIASPTAPKPEAWVRNRNPVAETTIRRHVEPAAPYIGIGPSNQREPNRSFKSAIVAGPHCISDDSKKWGEFAGFAYYNVDANHERVATIPPDYGRKRDKSGLPDLVLESPRIAPISWHREAPYHRWDDDKDPVSWWGLPKRPACHGHHPEGELYQDTALGGELPRVMFTESGPTRARTRYPEEGVWRRGTCSRKCDSAPVPKSPVRGDFIYERGIPNGPAHDPAARSGSRAGRAAFHLPRTAGGKRNRHAATINPAPPACQLTTQQLQAAQPPFLIRAHSGRCTACLDALPPAKEADHHEFDDTG